MSADPDDIPDFNNPHPRHLVRAEATRQGVNPDLAERMMRQESGGRQSAVSPKGARGLMQLMPGTARELGVNPRDPYQNVRGGVTYLRQQLDRFGNEQLAAAAYNAGPGAVVKAGNKVPRFKETQDYVRNVAPSDDIPDFSDEGLTPKVAKAPTRTWTAPKANTSKPWPTKQSAPLRLTPAQPAATAVTPGAQPAERAFKFEPGAGLVANRPAIVPPQRPSRPRSFSEDATSRGAVVGSEIAPPSGVNAGYGQLMAPPPSGTTTPVGIPAPGVVMPRRTMTIADIEKGNRAINRQARSEALRKQGTTASGPRQAIENALAGNLETVAGVAGGLYKPLGPIVRAISPSTDEAIESLRREAIDTAQDVTARNEPGFVNELAYEGGRLVPKMLTPGGPVGFGLAEAADVLGHEGTAADAAKAALTAAAMAKGGGALASKFQRPAAGALEAFGERVAANTAARMGVGALQGEMPSLAPKDVAFDVLMSVPGGKGQAERRRAVMEQRADARAMVAPPPRLALNPAPPEALARTPVGPFEAGPEGIVRAPEVPIRPRVLEPILTQGQPLNRYQKRAQTGGEVVDAGLPDFSDAGIRPQEVRSDVEDVRIQGDARGVAAMPSTDSGASIPPVRARLPEDINAQGAMGANASKPELVLTPQEVTGGQAVRVPSVSDTEPRLSGRAEAMESSRTSAPVDEAPAAPAKGLTSNEPLATVKQANALKIASRKHGVDLEAEAQKRFGVSARDLNKPQASELLNDFSGRRAASRPESSRKPIKAEGLTNAIINAGGLRPDTPEGSDFARYVSGREGGRPGVMNRAGHGVDDMMRMLEGEGYYFDSPSEMLDAVRKEQAGHKVYSQDHDYDGDAERAIQGVLAEEKIAADNEPVRSDATRFGEMKGDAELSPLLEKLGTGEHTDADWESFEQTARYQYGLSEEAIGAAKERADQNRAKFGVNQLSSRQSEGVNPQAQESGKRPSQRGSIRDAAEAKGDVDAIPDKPEGGRVLPRSDQGLQAERGLPKQAGETPPEPFAPVTDAELTNTADQLSRVARVLDELKATAKETGQSLSSLVEDRINQRALPGMQAAELTAADAGLLRSLAARKPRREAASAQQSALLETSPTLESKAEGVKAQESAQSTALAHSPLFEGKEIDTSDISFDAPPAESAGEYGFKRTPSAKFETREQAQRWADSANQKARRSIEIGVFREGDHYIHMERDTAPARDVVAESTPELDEARMELAKAIAKLRPYNAAAEEGVGSVNVHDASYRRLEGRSNIDEARRQFENEIRSATFPQYAREAREAFDYYETVRSEQNVKKSAEVKRVFDTPEDRQVRVEPARQRAETESTAKRDWFKARGMGRWVGITEKGIVEKAIARGETIPPEVLKDYPDLVEHHSQLQPRDEGKFDGPPLKLEPPKIEPVKGEHGQFINSLFKSPDVDNQVPAFWANPEVRAKLGLPRTGPMAATKDALAKAIGKPRSSHLSPEDVRQWASENGLSQDALTAIDTAHAQYTAYQKRIEAQRKTQGGFLRFGPKGPALPKDFEGRHKFLSPLSNLDFVGTYERRGGELGKRASDAINKAQFEILSGKAEHGPTTAKLRRQLAPIQSSLRDQGKPGLAEELGRHIDRLSRPDHAFSGVAGLLKAVQYNTKLRFNVKSAALNKIQPLSTLWPHVSTKQFASLLAQAHSPSVRKTVPSWVTEGAMKVETGRDTKGSKIPDIFGKASDTNRIMAYLHGKNDARRLRLTGEAAERHAYDWVKKVEFDNSAYNVPPILAGKAASVLGQFKGFTIKNLESITTDLKKHEGDRFGGYAARVGKRVIAQMVTGGVRSIPGMKQIGGVLIVGALAKALSKTGLDEDTANKMAEAVYYGAPSLIGEDLSGSQMILDEPFGDTLEEKIVSYVLGPSVSTGVKLAKLGGQAMEAKSGEERKEIGRKAANVVTPYTRAAEVGYQYATEGKASVYAGKEKADLNHFEAVMRALGFTPVKQTKGYDQKEAPSDEKTIHEAFKSTMPAAPMTPLKKTEVDAKREIETAIRKGDPKTREIIKQAVDAGLINEDDVFEIADNARKTTEQKTLAEFDRLPLEQKIDTFMKLSPAGRAKVKESLEDAWMDGAGKLTPKQRELLGPKIGAALRQ